MTLLFNLLPAKIVFFVQIDEELEKKRKKFLLLGYYFVYLQQKTEENEYCFVDSWWSRKPNGTRYS